MAEIALIGFGEAGRAVAEGWGLGGNAAPRVYDIKTDDPATRDAMLVRFGEAGVRGAATLADALRGAEIVLSLVTADRAAEVAEAAAPHLSAGAFYFDGNSCAPLTKSRAEKAVRAAHARYVDTAIMAPIHPRRHRTPMLLSGPEAQAGVEILSALDMVVEAVGDRVGEASSVKMLRSILVKGIEALTAECVLAARRAGVEGRVIASLDASDPGADWARRMAYNLERMMVHGVRRAAEMREVAATVADLGLPPAMARATVEWQERLGALGLPGGEDALGARADRILDALQGSAG